MRRLYRQTVRALGEKGCIFEVGLFSSEIQFTAQCVIGTTRGYAVVWEALLQDVFVLHVLGINGMTA
jgi:hypothetical protein